MSVVKAMMVGARSFGPAGNAVGELGGLAMLWEVVQRWEEGRR